MKTIAVAGKGGTGKTTISSLIIKWLLDNKKGSVLAIDADPNSNLGDLLGVKTNETIVGLIDEIAANPDIVPKAMSKNDYMETRMQEMIAESNGFDLLAMGRPEGPGCYCYANNSLRDILTKVTKSYDYTVMDNEAGMEHLSRRTMRFADFVFIISDNTVVGVRSAKRIFDLIKELKIKAKNIYLLLNRFQEKKDLIEDEIKLTKIPVAGYLPEDKALNEAVTFNRPLIDAKTIFQASKEINKILKETL